jgi:hypothetical protein
MNRWLGKADDYWFGPARAEPLAAFRIACAVALAAYFAHHALAPAEWLGTSPLHLPPLCAGESIPWRFLQPVYIAPMSDSLIGVMIGFFCLSALGLALGWRSRLCAAFLCLWVAVVTYADWIASFSINRSAVLVLAAMTFMPLDAAWSIRRRDSKAPSPTISAWSIRTLQWLLVTWYFASGIDKLRGGWHRDPYALWTQLQGWYQTPLAWWVLQHVPRPLVSGVQFGVLTFELTAWLFLIPPATRRVGVVIGVLVHLGVAMLMARLWMFSLYILAFYTLFIVPERRSHGHPK